MSDRFKQGPWQPTAEQQQAIDAIKQRAQVLDDMIDAIQSDGADPRLCAMAQTDLEKSVMCAVKAVLS